MILFRLVWQSCLTLVYDNSMFVWRMMGERRGEGDRNVLDFSIFQPPSPLYSSLVSLHLLLFQSYHKRLNLYRFAGTKKDDGI